MATPAGDVNPTAAGAGSAHTWEDTGGHTWETAVREDADGRIIVQGGDSVADMIRRRRKRLEQNDYAQRNRRVVRDMIRYLYILIDCSRWVREKDPVLPPGTRIESVLSILQDFFVQEYYDQNPLSHLGFVLIQNGEAQILTQLSSSSKTHQLALQSVADMVSSEGPKGGGEFSLQNGLEVAGRSLGHQPRHGSREIVIVCGALSTCDPGNVLTETCPRLKAAHIRVSTIALAAELHVCRKLAEETGGSMGVVLEKAHFRDWLLGQAVPPPALKKKYNGDGDDDDDDYNTCEMVQMGFPTRTKADIPTLVHASRDTKVLARTSFTCPQCHAKVSELPTDCFVCGLKLVLSPHLARSFHHLFPVAPFYEMPPDKDPSLSLSSYSNISSSAPTTSSLSSSSSLLLLVPNRALRLSNPKETTTCFGCTKYLGPGGKHPVPRIGSSHIGSSTAVVSSSTTAKANKKTTSSSSSSSKVPAAAPDKMEEMLRFQCPECRNVFCVDCDTFLHDTLHNCPGCLLSLGGSKGGGSGSSGIPQAAAQ